MADLKDSGLRQEFLTGAVRDIQEGKGRCDLLPLKEVASVLNRFAPAQEGVFTVLGNLAGWVAHPDAVQYVERALQAVLKQFFPDPYTAILEIAIHFEDGARKYGDNNWRKGIPATRYLDSAVRHYLKHMRGDTDEPHHRACAWNLLCMIWELKHHDQSIYKVKEKSE